MSRLARFLVLCSFIASPLLAQWEFGFEVARDSTSFEHTATSTTLDEDVLILGKVMAGYWSGPWNLEFSLQNGESTSEWFIIFPQGTEITRNRAELRGGYEVLPWLRLTGGLRHDRIEFVELFGGRFNIFDLKSNELFGGARLQTTPRRVGFYAGLELAAGSGDLRILEVGGDVDTTRVAIDLGMPIRLGHGQWSLTPGVWFESVEAADLSVDSARFYLQTRFRLRR
jgi:hypothetical protein